MLRAPLRALSIGSIEGAGSNIFVILIVVCYILFMMGPNHS